MPWVSSLLTEDCRKALVMPNKINVGLQTPGSATLFCAGAWLQNATTEAPYSANFGGDDCRVGAKSDGLEGSSDSMYIDVSLPLGLSPQAGQKLGKLWAKWPHKHPRSHSIRGPFQARVSPDRPLPALGNTFNLVQVHLDTLTGLDFLGATQ
jgi:hypothetical protein